MNIKVVYKLFGDTLYIKEIEEKIKNVHTNFTYATAIMMRNAR